MNHACCFCGKEVTLASTQAGILTLKVPAYDSKATQDLYCHGDCLKQRLSPDVPTLFDARGAEGTR
jgi:hypothetical protein